MSFFNVDHVQNARPYEVVHKFGYNDDIDTTTDPETVWSFGGLYTWPSAAGVTTIVSSDATDSGYSTGTITFADNPTAADTITLDGAYVEFTAAASDDTAAGTIGDPLLVNIKASLVLTLDEILVVCNGTALAAIAAATYSEDGATILTITHDTAGTDGNAFTLVASSDTVSAATLVSQVGAFTVVVQGVDASGNSLSETVVLTGAAAVTLTGVFYRTHRAWVETVGTNETNVGNLTIEISGTESAYIGAADGQTLMALYTVPNDYSWCQLRAVWATVGKKQAATVSLVLRVRPSGGAWRVFDQFSVMTVGTSSVRVPYSVPIEISPGSDIELRVIETDASDIAVSGSFDLILGN